MKKLKRVVYILVFVLAIWSILLVIDYSRIVGEQKPIFCAEKQEEGTFVGLGYSFYTYKNPITGKIEYVSYLFGREIVTNITN